MTAQVVIHNMRTAQCVLHDLRGRGGYHGGIESGIYPLSQFFTKNQNSHKPLKHNGNPTKPPPNGSVVEQGD